MTAAISSHRVNRVQWPRGPGSHRREDSVGDFGDQLAGDLRAVDVGQVVGDVPGGHPLRVEEDHLLVEAGQATGTLGDHRRRERAGSVPGDLDADLTDVGTDGLGGRSVAGVPATVTGGSCRSYPRCSAISTCIAVSRQQPPCQRGGCQEEHLRHGLDQLGHLAAYARLASGPDLKGHWTNVAAELGEAVGAGASAAQTDTAPGFGGWR